MTLEQFRNGVCFVHDMQPMQMTKIFTVILTDGSDYPTFKCSVEGCQVHFSVRRGFEEVKEGSRRETVYPPSRHPKCHAHDHDDDNDGLYMMLMIPATKGTREFACLLKSCTASVRYTIDGSAPPVQTS